MSFVCVRVCVCVCVCVRERERERERESCWREQEGATALCYAASSCAREAEAVVEALLAANSLPNLQIKVHRLLGSPRMSPVLYMREKEREGGRDGGGSGGKEGREGQRN